MFRILTRFHALYFGASCIHRNSIVWRRVNLARFPYWPEKRKRRISRYSYLMKTLISSEYGLTISGHVTVLRQWLSEKNTDYIINQYIAIHKEFILYHNTKCVSQYIANFPSSNYTLCFLFISCHIAIEVYKVYACHIYTLIKGLHTVTYTCKYVIMILLHKIQNKGEY